MSWKRNLSRATVPPVGVTLVIPGSTDSAGIPVTAEPEPLLAEIFVSYGLIGLTALFLILAVLNIAYKSTVPYIKSKIPPSDKM